MNLINVSSTEFLHVTSHGIVSKLEYDIIRGAYAVIISAHLVKISLPFYVTVHLQKKATLGSIYAKPETVHGRQTRNDIIYMTSLRMLPMFNNRLNCSDKCKC